MRRYRHGTWDWVAVAASVIAASVVSTPLWSSLAAQNRRPALPSDSVTRLAVTVSPAAQGVIVLLDEGHFRVEADGRSVQRIRQVLQVLDEAAAKGVAERAYAYAKSRQTLTVHWVRVLRPTGEVISDRAAQEQEGDLTAAIENPIYQEQRIRRLSLAGVTAGTIVDVSFSLEDRAPLRPGDFLFRWNLNGPVPVRRSQLTVDVPSSLVPRVIERNLTIRRRETEEAGRVVRIWQTRDQLPVSVEPFASDSNGVLQSVIIAPAGSWHEVTRWFDALARPRYVLPTDAAERSDSVVQASGAATRGDTIRALHRWIAQDIRYVSVSLGIGGYQPRAARDVLTSGFGDCKDKTTLFVAALRRYGIAADPVLLSFSAPPDRRTPSIQQFNHAIAAVREGDRWVYTDLTADLIPYGLLPERYQGWFGVQVQADGAALEVVFPAGTAAANRSRAELHFTVEESGRMAGRVLEETAGAPSLALRAAFPRPLDAQQRANVTRALAQRFYGTDAVMDSLVAFDGRDLSAPTTLQYHVTFPEAVKAVGSARLLTIPLGSRGPARTYRTVVRELESRSTRQAPIDAVKLVPPVTTIIDLRITLPVGWTAELPTPVTATSFFARYSSEWTQRGREVRLVRSVQGERGIFPPARIAEVLVWLRTVGADDQEYLSLRAP